MDGLSRTQGRNRFCKVLMVAASLSPSIATAAESVLPAGSSPDLSSFLSVLLKLAAVLATIVIVAWLFRRVGRLQKRSSKNLEVIDVLPVGPRERILLVRAGDTQLLVGMTPGRLNTLQRLDRPVSYREVAELHIADNAA